jgi:hypothetical protein
MSDFGAPGLETYEGGNWRNDLQVGTGSYGYPQAHAMLTVDDTTFYFIAPGYGVETQYNLGTCTGGSSGGCGDPPCETERPNPSGGPYTAQRVKEEQLKPRTMFSVAEARELVETGKLELYDTAGRRARNPGSGIYFVLLRDKAGVVAGRRTVVVTP